MGKPVFCKDDLECISFNNNEFKTYEGLKSQCFDQSCFSEPDSEENIRLSRAPKSPSDNGLNFLLAAEQQNIWHGGIKALQDYFLKSNFQNISEKEFYSLVSSQTERLIPPLSMPFNESTFIGSVAICTLKDDLIVDLFAEYQDEYIHFFWESLA